MANNNFGKPRIRVAGELAGFPLVGINTMPIMIDDCPVNINFATSDEDGAPALDNVSIERALAATYAPGIIPSEDTTQDIAPVTRPKNIAPAVDAAELRSLLAEGKEKYREADVSVDL